MNLKYLFIAFPFFLSNVSLAVQLEEHFELSCLASQSKTEESLKADAKLTITARPSTGAALNFSYEPMDLPFQAKVEVDFGETLQDDKWRVFLIDVVSSEKFGLVEQAFENESQISTTSKTPDALTELTLSCRIKRL